MDDLFQNSDDEMRVEPGDLGAIFTSVLTSSLAKNLAGQYNKPWTEAHESELQGKISELVAAAKERGLKTIRVIVTRRNGEEVVQEMDINRINKTRSLQ